MTLVESKEWIMAHYDPNDGICAQDDALKIAIDCIDKRIAAKPQVIRSEGLPYPGRFCPSCAHWLYTEFRTGYMSPEKKPLFCQHCGQAIDWS